MTRLAAWLTFMSDTPLTTDMKKLLGEKDGSPPTKEAYIKYVLGIASNSVMPHIAEAIADEVWKNLSEIFEDKPFAPSGTYDIDILMTIPL